MNKNNIWDITPLVTTTFPLWPGSEPLQRNVACDITLGDVVTSSNINATVHLGAHADARNTKKNLKIQSGDYERYLCFMFMWKLKKIQIFAVMEAEKKFKFLLLWNLKKGRKHTWNF